LFVENLSVVELQAAATQDYTGAYVLIALLLALGAIIGFVVGTYFTDRSYLSKRTVSLEELVVRARYSIPFHDINQARARLERDLNYDGLLPSWNILAEGNTIEIMEVPEAVRKAARVRSRKKAQNEHFKGLRNTRVGIPKNLVMITSGQDKESSTADVTCRPVLYYRITQLAEYRFPSQAVEEAQGECIQFVKKVMVGVLSGTELLAPMVRSTAKENEATEVMSMNGLSTEIGLLTAARDKLVQGHPEDAAKDCRTVLEHTVAKAAEGAGGRTNAFENDIQRLLARGRMSNTTAGFIREFYGYLSEDVHGRFVPDRKEGGFMLQVTESCVLLLIG
jgi:hypothetical protein